MTIWVIQHFTLLHISDKCTYRHNMLHAMVIYTYNNMYIVNVEFFLSHRAHHIRVSDHLHHLILLYVWVWKKNGNIVRLQVNFFLVNQKKNIWVNQKKKNWLIKKKYFGLNQKKNWSWSRKNNHFFFFLIKKKKISRKLIKKKIILNQASWKFFYKGGIPWHLHWFYHHSFKLPSRSPEGHIKFQDPFSLFEKLLRISHLEN